MTLNELCQKIGLQDEIWERVSAFADAFDFSPLSDPIHDLTDPTHSADALVSLTEALGDDPNGIKILCCYLLASMTTRERYLAMGLDESLFWDTLKCFPRFIGETLERKGMLAFDRASWSRRHLDMSLIRIGALEYERKLREGERVIAIHIPSDADFSSESLDASFTDAKKLIRTLFSDYAKAPITCESWLMYKGLCDVLRTDSKILAFQARFDITVQHPVSDAYLVFIFHRADCGNYQALPEHSSLQRNVKSRLLSGGGIGGGFGILREIQN